MISINSLVKQVFINSFNLSSDLLNEIKSYLFYDVKSWEQISFIKNKKERICHLFRNSTISRANPHDFFEDDPDTDEHWGFRVFDDEHEHGNNKQFQCVNCMRCGNYKVMNIIEKIMCQCFDDDVDDFYDDEHDDDSIGV